MLLMSEKLKATDRESGGLRTEGIDRRRFLRRAAVTTAWAVPVISTFSAAPAYAACLRRAAQCGVVACSLGLPITASCVTTDFGACCSGCNCLPPDGLCVPNQPCTCRNSSNPALCPV